MGAVNHPRRLLGFLLAAALGLGALSCHNNSLPVAPLRSASLKVKVKVPAGAHASTNYQLALLYAITGNGAAPVTGVQGPFSATSLSGTIDFSVDVSGSPSSRVMAFQLNDTSDNGVVAIGASALNLTGETQDLTVQLGSVTKTGYNVSGLSPPGSYGFDGNLISGLAQSQFGYDINVTGSSPNYQFASAYTPNNISYLGNGDIVNFAFVPSSPASFFANSTLAKNNAGLSATDLAVGDIFCVQLSTGGYAWVQITGVGVTGPSFFFRTNTSFPYFAYQQTTFDLNYVTPTFTPSVTVTETISSTPVFTATSTDTPADTDTLTMTVTPSATVSPTSTETSSFTTTPSPTNSPTPTPTITDTPTSTPTMTQTSTNTATATNSPTSSSTVTDSPTQTATFTDTPTSSFTVTQTQTNSDTATGTATSSYTVTDTPVNSFTVTDSPTDSMTDTPTASPTGTNTLTSTATGTFTASFTPTDTVTDTGTPTSTPTATGTPTYSSTVTNTPTDSFTVTDSPTDSMTDTPTASPTGTNTSTSTATGTFTATFTPTDTLTDTDTPTSTPTITFTSTDTATVTDSPTATETSTNSATASGTPTDSLTPTATGSQTYTSTVTPTVTVTGTPTQTWNPTMTGGVLSGSVSYTGSLNGALVDANHPIWVGLFNGANFNNPVTYALVNSNGGTYRLQAKVAGTYYIATSYEAFGGASSSPVQNGGGPSYNPFVVYGAPDVCVPSGGTAVNVSQFSSGPNLSFSDTCQFAPTTLTGAVSYSGTLNGGVVDADHPLWVGVFTSADLTHAQGGPVTYTLVNSNNGAYSFVAPGPGLYYLAYSFEANGGPAANPTGDTGNSGNPFRVYGNTGSNCSLVATKGVTLAGGTVSGPLLSLDDTCTFTQGGTTTPTSTPTSSVIQLGFDGTTPVTVTGDTSLSQDRYNQPIALTSGGEVNRDQSLAHPNGGVLSLGSFTYYGQGSPDVAYAFTLNTDQSVFLNLCGATFDSILYIRTDPNDPGTTVAMDDDSNYCGVGFNSSSLVTGTLKAGVTYYVIVDGYGGNDEGTYSLSLSDFTPNYALATTSQPVPEMEPNNDDNNFSNPTDFGSVDPGTHIVGQGRANYFMDQVDTWHFHVGTGGANYTISLDGFDDGSGKVHMGFDLYGVGDGTYLIDSSSDTGEPNQLTENLSEGDYYVAVYAFDEGAPGGDYRLVVQGEGGLSPVPTLTPTQTSTPTATPTVTATLPTINELSVDPVLGTTVVGYNISTGDNFSEIVDLGQSESVSGDGPSDLYSYGVGANDQTFYFVLDQPLSLHIYLTLANFDSVLYLRTNPSDPSTTVALDDDSDFLGGTSSSLITGTLQAGVTYYVTVDGFSPSDTGTFVLHLVPFSPSCTTTQIASPVTEMEPNNDDNYFYNASKLGYASAGTTLQGNGTVNYYFDDVDTWAFNVQTEGDYNISLDCFDDNTGKARIGFDLYQGYSLINSSDDLTVPNTVTQHLTPGTYEVAVYAFDAGAPSGDYKLFVEPLTSTSPTGTPTETYPPTDTPTVTPTVPPVVDVTTYIDGTPVAGNTTGAPDNYYQQINVPLEGGGQSVSFFGQGAPDVVYSFNITQPKSLAIYCNSSFQSLLYVKASPENFSNSLAFDEFPYDFSDTNSSLVTGVLQPGTYYIVVDGYDSESFGAFNLTLSTFTPNCALNPTSTPVMEIEPNNDDNNFTKATYLGVVPQGSDAVGAGHVDSYFDSVDTWRFHVPVGGYYAVSADCYDDGTQRSFAGLDLYDSHKQFFDSSPDDSEPNQIVDYLAPGDYYVGVYANNENAPSADYRLVVQGVGLPTDTPTETPTGTWSTPTETFTVTNSPTVTGTPTATQTAIVIPTDGSGIGVTLNGDTTDGIDNYYQGGEGGAPDAAYRIHVDNPASLLISLCGSSFDTVLYVRTNLNDPNSTIAYNDDSNCLSNGSNSELLTGTLQPGDYYVIVDGYSAGSFGAYTLSMTQFVTPCLLTPGPVSPPVSELEPNGDDNEFSNATGLGSVSSGGDLVGQGVVGAGIGLNLDQVDTWSFTAGSSAAYTISLDCFDNGGGLASVGFDLYDSNLNFLGSSPDTADLNQWTQNLQPGKYYIAVYPFNIEGTGISGAIGYHLVVQGGAAVATATPTPVLTPVAIPDNGSVLTLSGDTTGGTDSFNQPMASDGVTFGKGAPDMVYALSVTQAGSYYIRCNSDGGESEDGFYASIYLRTNLADPNSTINLDAAQYHDYSYNTGFVTGVLQVGTYYLIVDGNNFGSQGGFTVNASAFNSVCAVSPAPNAPATVVEIEPNDDGVNFTKPTFLGTVGNGNDLVGSGTVNYFNDRTDTWHFKASTTNGTYTISLDCFDDGNGSILTPQFTVYDSRHNYIAGSNGYQQPNQIIQFLPQGDYYVAIQLQNAYSDSIFASNYHLVIQGSAPPTPTLSPTPTSTPPYSAGVTWAINGATLNDPTGIALDASGNVYVSDFGNNRILKFDSSGSYQAQFTDPAAGNNFFPAGLAVNSSGSTVFTADQGFEQRVDAFYSNAGSYSFAWGSSIPSGVAGVAVDNSGYVYATGGAEIQANYLFKFLSTGGSPINTWGPSGGPAQFNIPVAVAVNSDATIVYEADNYNFVNVYHFDGTNYSYQFQFTVPSGEGIGGMTLDSAGNVYTSVRYGGQIFKFDSGGNLLTQLGDGTIYGGGLAVDSSGNIYETTGNGTLSNNIILKYNSLP